jgi:hypothetical protein
MSRGLGRVLQAGHPPRVPSLGYSARELAIALTASDPPTRSAVVSAGRAMRELHAAGLIDLRTPHCPRRGANLFAAWPPR